MANDISLVFNLLSRDKASAGIMQVSNTVRAANLASAASSVVLGAAEASAAAWAVALGSAISGSIGLAPAVFEGATAAGIGLKLALAGLGTAYQALGAQQAATGPSAAEIARQHASAMQSVTSAQEALARAQRDALSAQKAISDAEETAAKNIRDLAISTKDAQLDQESATLAVTDAQKALTDAQQTGDPEAIMKANIAYQQSVDDLETAKNKTSDLNEEQTKATQQGIEGSDAVVAAKQQEADAVQAVKDATVQLANAQANLNAGSGGGGAAASASAVAMAALSSNGRALVLTLKSLAPAWDNVDKGLQNHTLAGVSGDIRQLSSAYLPVMRARLNDMGDGFNLAIRQSLGILKTKQGVSDVNEILTNTDKAVREIGTAFAPIISGLLGMGAAGSGFLPMMAGWVAGLAKEFSAWVTQARASGQLGNWLATAEHALHDIWIVGGNVAGIIGDIFRAGGAGAGNDLLDTIVKLTTSLRTFMGSAKGQQDISEFFDRFRDVLGSVAQLLPTVAGHTGEFRAAASVASTVVGFLAAHTGLLAKALPFLAAGYVLVKGAQTLGIARDLIHLPILAASAIANWRLASAMKAQTAQMSETTAATEAQTTQQEASTIASDEQAVATDATTVSMDAQAGSLEAMTIATDAQAASTEAATVAEEELDVAFLASPIGWIVIAIMALIAGFVLLWTKCAWFRDFWKGLWHDIQDAFGAVWSFIKDHWQLLLAILTGPVGLAVLFIKDHFNQILSFITGLPGKIAHAATGMWDGVKNAFKDAINFIIRGWDGIHLQLPSVNTHIPGVGVIGGFDLRVPQLHQLALGGVIKATPGGTAFIAGEAGEDEVVAPLSSLGNIGGGSGGGGNMTLTIDSGGSEMDDLIVKIIRKAVKAQGGNLAVLGLRVPKTAS